MARSLSNREAYLRELSLDEVAFILANGAMHSVLAHQNRKAIEVVGFGDGNRYGC